MQDGDTLPAVTATTPAGEPLALGDLPVPAVIYFYPKDDTPGCTREAQEFSVHAAEFAALDVSLLGISKDPPTKHAKFIAKHGLTIALASDDDGTVCDVFGVWGEKQLYGRRYMGIERATFLFGRDCKLVRAWRNVKVPGHVEAVLAAAKDLIR